MTTLHVTLPNGTVVHFKTGDSIDSIKEKLGENVETIFEGVDDGNNILDASEVEKLKQNLSDNNYTVEVAEDGKTPKKAFNDAIQNMRNRYDNEALKNHFKQDENDLHTIVKGDTLYAIAKHALEEEGLPTDARSINDRIAQIANINNINDVNNIRIDTKLIVKLNETAVQKVQESENNSAAALGGTNTSESSSSNGNRRAQDTSPSDKPKTSKKEAAAIAGKESTIKISDNGITASMTKEGPVDKDGNLIPKKNGKFDYGQAYKDGGYIQKYSSGDTVVYQTTWEEGNDKLSSNVKLCDTDLNALKEKKQKFLNAIGKVKNAPANETGDAKKERVAQNLAALKELIEVTDGNIQVIKNVAIRLQNENYVDRTSDDYKAFVQDLLLTRNADVVKSLLFDKNNNFSSKALEKDKTAHETVIGMYQEIREKELDGQKLSDEEIELKNVLKKVQNKAGYKIEADTENGVYEKEMVLSKMDDSVCYQAKIDGYYYWASDPQVLDKFLKKLEAADTAAKKVALFKEYMNTKDTNLANCLAAHVADFGVGKDDIETLLKSNGMITISYLPDNAEYSKEVVDAVVARIKDIYTSDKGNLENASYLDQANKWIDKTDLSDDDKADAKEKIFDTYFTIQKDEDGNDEYTFAPKPDRRPTYEEMEGLMTTNKLEVLGALADSIKLDDMGKGQYSEAFEKKAPPILTSYYRYADMVDSLTTKEEVIDFIENKITARHYIHIPFDKIMEKFPDDADIRRKLFKYATGDCSNSNANRLKLASDYFETKDNNLIFKADKLPKGKTVYDVLAILPADCTKDDAKKYFETAIKLLGKDDVDKIAELYSKNRTVVKSRIGTLINENKTDNDFIQKVCTLDSTVVPFDTLITIDAAQAQWNEKTKSAVFEKFFNNRVLVKNEQEELNMAVKNHWVTKINNILYCTGESVYVTNWQYYGADGKFETDDDTVCLKRIPMDSYEKGTKMFSELDGYGSGNIAKMLRSSKEEGYENFVNKDDIVGILTGFNAKSPTEGLMKYIAWEFKLSSGKKPGKALCNRIPKALMRKAAELGLKDTKEYKALKDFFGADDNFNFTKNDEAASKYDVDTAADLDKKINALYNVVLGEI